MIHNVAKSWLVSLALAACAAVATGIGVGIFALWKDLSESGLDVKPEYANGGCDAFYTDYTDHMCRLDHAGWGYGPTTLWFVLIVWTVTALVIVLRGKGE